MVFDCVGSLKTYILPVLVLHIEKKAFLEILCYGPKEVGFQTRVILDLLGMAFHAMVAFGLGCDFLLKSISTYCAYV